MAAEIQPSEPAAPPTQQKRKPQRRNAKKPNKKHKPASAAAPKSRKPNFKMQKLYRRRAKQYDSDDEADEESDAEPVAEDPEQGNSSGSEGEAPKDRDSDDDGEHEDDDAPHHGITKLAEGSRAFKLAFSKIMKMKLKIDALGPIMKAHKAIVAEKLAEEVTEHKAKADTRKQKLLAQEKGHVKPESFLNTTEKYLISVATKGVVKLFNAVSKAQSAQKGLDPSKSKDAKVLAKRRKQTFLSELKKSTDNPPFNASMVPKNANGENNDEPGWAPLRDSYMLTSSKLKNWDKMTDSTVDDQEQIPTDSSSDEE